MESNVSWGEFVGSARLEILVSKGAYSYQGHHEIILNYVLHLLPGHFRVLYRDQQVRRRVITLVGE